MPSEQAEGRPLVAVAIATRNRADRLAGTLDALDAQIDTDFPIVVVDQSDADDAGLLARESENDRLQVIRDDGRGTSRARNLAWRSLDAEWIAYMDDDCLAERDWAAELRAMLEGDPPVELVSGHVGGEEPEGGDYVAVTTLPIEVERTIVGRWTRPWEVGFGVCMGGPASP